VLASVTINEETIRDFIICFTSILYEAMPFIVLGAVIAGVLEEVVPQQLIARIVPKNKYLAIGMSALLGLVFPMCECGIVPVMRRLLRTGLPLSCCTAYLLAGPIINPVVILSTWVAFQITDNKSVMEAFAAGRGHMIVYLRVLGAFLIAVTTSLIVHRLYLKYGNDLLKPLARPDEGRLPTHKPDEKAISSPAEAHQLEEADEPTLVRKSLWQRIGNIAETSLHDFVDITLFLILGALMAAATRLALTSDAVGTLSNTYPILAILGLMGLAIILCLCSEADAFVAASFTELQPAAKLSFLVLGPMLDLKLYMMYTRVFRPLLIWTIFGCVIVLTLVYTTVVHYAWVAFVVPSSPPTLP
jgi:uncharacterized membrane protein YraQ (UPF0718 family)